MDRPTFRPPPTVHASGAAPPGRADGNGTVRSPVTSTRRALVLNATFEPLGIVSSRRAVLLVLDTKAELLHATERVFRAERVTVPEPSVVRLIRYVKVPYNYRVAVNRRTVFARDGGKCQYCGASAENLDHVIPRSKGGPHTWTACPTRPAWSCAPRPRHPGTGCSSSPCAATPATTGPTTSAPTWSPVDS
jgi:hypothetical protein